MTKVLKKVPSVLNSNPTNVYSILIHSPINKHKRYYKDRLYPIYLISNTKTTTSKNMTTRTTSTFLLLFLLHVSVTVVNSIGVNYGTLADNLPPPTTVANFLKTNTIIDRVKIFDVSPQILQAFANTGISVTVTAPNGDIAALGNINSARQWVQQKIKPFYPATKINYILVGSEVLHWGDANMIRGLVPAMRTLHSALVAEGINDIKVTFFLVLKLHYF